MELRDKDGQSGSKFNTQQVSLYISRDSNTNGALLTGTIPKTAGEAGAGVVTFSDLRVTQPGTFTIVAVVDRVYIDPDTQESRVATVTAQVTISPAASALPLAADALASSLEGDLPEANADGADDHILTNGYGSYTDSYDVEIGRAHV